MVIDQNAGTFDQYISFREFKKLLNQIKFDLNFYKSMVRKIPNYQLI